MAQTGNIDPDGIEIDANANLVDNNTGGLNGGTVDWVDDPDEANAGTGCLTAVGIAECNEENVTAAEGGQGTWHGVRIIDGVGDTEADVFEGGSHFDDPPSWIVGDNNLGGAKFDGDQAYLANNDDNLFFAMQRIGNNGTTAWDFEFNALGPDPETPYTPNRSVGDKLFVFEMNGSGGSGFVLVFLYEYNGTEFELIDPIPNGIFATINNTAIAAGPWGFRTSKGAWVLGNLARLTFAEVALPIGEGGIELPVNPENCNRSAFVAIRTRASNQFTSDMKDAFPIFEYVFEGISVTAAKTAESASALNVALTAEVTGGSPTLQWQVFDGTDWVDITGATATTLIFPNTTFDFETYGATAVLASAFSIGTDSYVGKVLTVQLRATAEAELGGETCTIVSNGVTVKKLLAVDP